MDGGNVHTVEEIAKRGFRLVESGAVRNHKLGNDARVHTGELEEREGQIFRDFLQSKNCCIAYELTGSECYA